MLASLAGISSGGETGLIDGGATHCLRFGAPHEFRLAKPVTVRLAPGVSEDLRINAVGTLLSADPGVQPIVPMGPIADRLGCIIVWQAKSCETSHPQLGPLQIHMCGGCPEVARDTCLALISELEEIRGEGMLKSLSVERVIPEVTTAGRHTTLLSYQHCLNQCLEGVVPERPYPCSEARAVFLWLGRDRLLSTFSPNNNKQNTQAKATATLYSIG